MKSPFIKIANQDLAQYLAGLGFQYTKEGVVFAFVQSDELLSILNKTFSNSSFVSESKLRF